jgi:choline kinase
MGKVKTTINIDEELWKRFSLLVIEEMGSRKKNEVVERLIREYIEKREKKEVITVNKAVILSAGLGTRLRPLTEKTPKCLLKIDHQTILEHQMENLTECGINEVTIVIGYEANKVKELCKKNAWNLNFIHNRDYLNSNNLFSLWLARETFDQGFISINSDVVFNVNILKNLLRFKADICIAVDKKVCIEEDMKVKMEDGKVIEINKSMKTEETYGEFIGIAKFSSKGIKQLVSVLGDMPTDTRKNANLGFGIQKLIENGYEVLGVDAQRRFSADIDFVEDLMDARAHFLRTPKPTAMVRK